MNRLLSLEVGSAFLAYVLSSSSTFAQEKDVCSDPARNWPLPYLVKVTKQVDGYRGFSNHPRDGKLGLEEYADYRHGNEICKYHLLEVEREICAGRRKTKEKWLVSNAEINIREVKKSLQPFDANRDGYLTPEDDVDGNGYLTCQDTKKYVPPPKKIKPAKQGTMSKPMRRK